MAHDVTVLLRAVQVRRSSLGSLGEPVIDRAIHGEPVFQFPGPGENKISPFGYEI